MLTWPHGGTDWKPYLRQITDTYLELSEIITRYEQLLIATPIVESTRRMLASRLSKEQMDRVHLYDIDSNDTWARDHGPITLVSKNSHNGLIVPIHLLDFRFNGWGEKFDPNRHQAMAMIPSSKPAQTVVQVFQKGYLLHDRVLRPALVAVSSGPGEAQGAPADGGAA